MQQADLPLVRVLRGSPTEEELAALVAVVAARAASTAPSDFDSSRVRRSVWNDPARSVRSAHRPGPGAWRASAWPG